MARTATGAWAPRAVLALALVLVAAACGRPAGQVEDAAPGGRAAPGAPAVGSAAAPTGDFGDLAAVCGPGDASGATDVGVSDDAIRVGTIADPGFSGAPGTNQELFDTAEAFVGWCNAAGGILGRRLEVDLLDARLVEYRPRVLEACDRDLALVGGGGILDDTGVEARVACGLPDVNALTVSPAAAEADLLVEALPNPSDQWGVGIYRMLQQEHPALPRRFGVLWFNAPQGRSYADRAVAAVEQLGWDVAYAAPYNLAGEANWAPFVQAMRDAGVTMFEFFGEPTMLVALQQAMADQGWFPALTVLDASHYNGRYVELGGRNARDTFVWLHYHPFEEADRHAATRQYLDVLAREAPGAKPSHLGMQAWSAWLLFARSAAACGSELTRECLLDRARAVTGWTGGGLHVPVDPASRQWPDCVMVLQVTPDGYVRRQPPGDGFACDPAYVVSVGDAAWGPGGRPGGAAGAGAGG
ncbi:MAG: ABC transporter substrate-binding protein [Acidimicrobiales bacterium]|nr:ABC transporter substrate-binding protein [Acidimicrobiales bacterium]